MERLTVFFGEGSGATATETHEFKRMLRESALNEMRSRLLRGAGEQQDPSRVASPHRDVAQSDTLPADGDKRLSPVMIHLTTFITLLTLTRIQYSDARRGRVASWFRKSPRQASAGTLPVGAILMVVDAFMIFARCRCGPKVMRVLSLKVPPHSHDWTLLNTERKENSVLHCVHSRFLFAADSEDRRCEPDVALYENLSH